MSKTETTERYIECELRADFNKENENIRHISGVPIVFNKKTNYGVDSYEWEEEIVPSALSRADFSDMYLTINHDRIGLPLARVKNGHGTLKYTVDREGLKFDTDVDITKSERARELINAIERGDVSGMSFSFAIRDGGDDWRQEDGVLKRQIKDIAKVFEISVVNSPAYKATSVHTRSEVDAFAGLVDAKRNELELEKLRAKAKLSL